MHSGPAQARASSYRPRAPSILLAQLVSPKGPQEEGPGKKNSRPTLGAPRRGRGGTSRDEHSCPELTTRAKSLFPFRPKGGSVHAEKRPRRGTRPGLTGLGFSAPAGKYYGRKTCLPLLYRTFHSLWSTLSVPLTQGQELLFAARLLQDRESACAQRGHLVCFFALCLDPWESDRVCSTTGFESLPTHSCIGPGKGMRLAQYSRWPNILGIISKPS